MQYTIKSKVLRGLRYGRKIGYPTINLERRSFSKMKNKPALGVYAGFVFLKEDKYRAGIVIGPIESGGLPKIEAHLLGFKKNIYGEKVVIEINKFIRGFKDFKTEKELIAQIKRDLKKC